MNTSTQNDLSQYINDENTKPIRIISIALAAGVTLFAVVCFVFYFMGADTPADNSLGDNIQSMLGLVLILLAIPMYSLVFLFPGVLLKLTLNERSITIGNTDSVNPENLLSLTVTHLIIKMAMLEGVSLFGLIIFLLSTMNKSIYTDQANWLMLVPWMIMLGYIITNFPTKEKMIEIITYKILPEIK